MKQFLYISALSSEHIISDIYEKTGMNPGYAVQKFSRLIVKGLIANGAIVTALSNPPVNKQYTKKLWVKLPFEKINDIPYYYIPFLNIPVLRHLCVFLHSFIYVLMWGTKNKGDKSIVCDVLCVSACIGALLASKIVGLKSVGVVTDIYSQMIGVPTVGIMSYVTKLASFLNKQYVGLFSHYVLLTEEMNELVNQKKRPYIVMEALCDLYQMSVRDFPHKKTYPRVIIYAGGLEERYGLKMLVDAFKELNNSDLQLHIYGSGSYVDQLIDETKLNSSIVYKGVRPNEEILEAEKSATLLVNPRFSNEEFTKYSFPSKNMEYMASGTPLLTTKLPGMPEEYFKYVFLFEDESVSGFAHKLSEICNMDQSALDLHGENARRFVLEQKNYIKQTYRIISLVSQ